MEAVAAAASIAGIITVVGQSIDGLIKFSDFFSDIASASKTISRLLSDINSLIQVLEDIGDVLEQAQARRRNQNFASLDIKLEDCAKDVQIWLATARLLRPGSDSGGKAWLRKFRLAVNNTAIQTIRDEIGRHRQTLCLSLAVFGRTIDIDTSDQVHHIGGRFNEALSTSLSVHGAHEEALRRIEHYSMTSMHSSAHSIRSMDSIRMELSRLEGMITSASATHPSEVETGNTHRRRDSKSTERRNSAAEGGKRDSNMSISGPLPEHSGENSTARHSGTAFAPRQNSIDRTRKSQESSSQSQRTREVAAEHCIEFDHQISSTDYRSLVDETDDVKNRSMENPAQEGNKSSFLYAEFSKKSQPRQVESSAVEIDHGAIHRILRQSLAVIYPPEVVDYVSVKHFTTLCEDHMKLLDIRPNIQVSPNGKVKYVDDDTPASARPSMIHLKDRLIELRTAIQLSRERCIQAGYSLSELDNLLSSPGSGSYAPASQPPPMPETDGEDDSSSIYSEDFHSTTE